MQGAKQRERVCELYGQACNMLLFLRLDPAVHRLSSELTILSDRFAVLELVLLKTCD